MVFDIQLLTRVFDIMRAKNPEMVTGEKKKFVMKPPQVVRIGTKKTSFANFTDICKMYVDESLRLLLSSLTKSLCSCKNVKVRSA